MTPLEQIKATRKNKKPKNRRVSLVVPKKTAEVKYRRGILRITNKIKRSVDREIIPILKRYQLELIRDSLGSIVDEIELAFNRLRGEYVWLENEYEKLVGGFVGEIDQANSDRFNNSVSKVVGVDVGTLVNNENLSGVLKSANRANVSLITTVNEDYLKDIEQMIYREVAVKTNGKSMIDEIKKINGNVTWKAKRIARDQTSKLNAALTQERQTALGVEEYIWITAKDGDRVRESHRSKHGKKFRWDSPPADTGHPSTDINCRCIAQAVIKI